MKIFKTIVLTAIFVFHSLPVQAFYNDVNETTIYYSEIKELFAEGKLPDFVDNNLHPEKYLNYPDLIFFLLNYKNIAPASKAELPFSDTQNNAYYSNYLQKALEMNLIQPKGFPPKIGINKLLTKKNVLESLFKFLGIGTDFFFDKNEFLFKDIDSQSSTASLAFKANEIGILETDKSNFKMAKRPTRAELIHYFYQIENYNPELKVKIEKVSTTTNTAKYSKTEKELIEDENFEILLDIWSKLKTEYLYKEDLNNARLIQGAIKGLVYVVEDIHTIFQTPDEAAEFMQILSNEYEGIGAVLEENEGQIIVTTPMKNSPAEEAGIKPKDVIIKLDDESILGKSLSEVIEKIKGKAGTYIKISILRDGTEKEFNIKRTKITQKSAIKTIYNYLNKKIAQIELVNFGEYTAEEMQEIAEDIQDEKIDGIILDLRNNPGGYLQTAISIAGMFSTDIFKVLYFVDTAGQYFYLETDGNGSLAEYKTVVLINEGSASASEVLAAALKENELAEVVGTNSYGKGTIQDVQTYPNEAIFKYTIAEWFTPLNEKIDGIGLAPNIIVENNDPTKDKQLEAALKQF